MRNLAAVLLFLIATNARAELGRPVSDLRFESHVTANFAKVASDGTDFLVLSTVARGRTAPADRQRNGGERRVDRDGLPGGLAG